MVSHSRLAFQKVWKLVSLSVALLAVSGGCGSRRQAMRPVYVGPATPVIAPSSAPCSVGSVSPAFSQPGDLSAPSGAESPEILQQSGTREEPILNPATPGASSGDANVPRLNAPNASRTTNRRPAVDSRSTPTARDRVSMHMDDPNELFLPPKADRPWRYIVLHHSEHATGSYAQIDKEHRQNLGTQGCGYHFIVGNGSESKDGLVEVARRWSDQKAGAHCRDSNVPDANDYGIGICLVGDLNSGPPTAQQVDATRALIAYLRDRYAIPADHIVAHSAVANSAADCPGRYFLTNLLADARSFAAR